MSKKSISFDELMEAIRFITRNQFSPTEFMEQIYRYTGNKKGLKKIKKLKNKVKKNKDHSHSEMGWW